MQIILVQAEIEEAIRNYINEQMTIRDDMEISIDLKATRGAEGFMANIDINRKGYTPQIPAAPVIRNLPLAEETTPQAPDAPDAAPTDTTVKSLFARKPE